MSEDHADKAVVTPAPDSASNPTAGPTGTVIATDQPKAGGATPVGPLTLAIDIGGTGLKASVLDANGAMVADRVVVKTTYPCPPTKLIDDLAALVAPLPAAARISAGFPGMVRKGRVLSAPHFSTEGGPGTKIDEELVKQWDDFDLAGALRKRLGKPSKVANDADLQGAAVVDGKGLELVITLGTGVGTALFYDGRLMPHLEFAHHPFRKGETYNEQLGDVARKEIGNQRWNKRVRRAIDTMRALTFFDHLYIGGGNAKHLVGDLGDGVSTVDNTAGILGGIKLWGSRQLSV
jgi:polyphosphate glucokinase